MADLTIIKDSSFQPFDRYIDSHGLRIFVLDGVSDPFIKKLAATYEAMFANNSLIDISDRTAFKETLQNKYVFQRVGVENPAHYGGGDKLPGEPAKGNYQDNQTDYIWETTSASAASQINEVLEHFLHTITAVALNDYKPEWKWTESSSSINLAMQQAIDGGYYDVSSYANVTDPEGYKKTIATEFAYWLVLAEWGYFEIADKVNDNTEFTLQTASDIAVKLPLAHQLYLDTFAKIFSVPDKTLIQALFSKKMPYDFSTYTGLENVMGTALADQLYGNEHNNIITGKNGNDTIYGNAGNDTIFADGGSDTIQGGAGLDTIKYALSKANYTLAVGEISSTVKEISTGTNDSLSTVERVVFSDKAVALDIGSGEVGGSCYRIYKAAFNRTPDEGGLGYWIGQMDLGKTLVEVSAGFIDSDEFRASYGTNPSNGEFLTKVYNNVLGRDPDSGGYDWWVDQLANNPEKSWSKVMADFSEGTENQANVLELIGNGVQYDLWVA